MSKLYKYIGPDILDVAFSNLDSCGFKFSYPKDYNDPYELFLTIDFENNKQIAAFFNEVIREIQQFPTTCFSKSPIVTPMWAHYAHSSRGFVIEVDEIKLKEHYEDISINDVVYQDTPRSELQSTFQMAFHRSKPRDLMFLRNGVQYAAYFTKHSCWQYELERRAVVSEEDVVHVNGNMVVYMPADCITAIIAGPNTEQVYKKKAIDLSGQIQCSYFEVNIGKSSSSSYLVGQDGNAYVFDGSNIIKSSFFCSGCKEPVKADEPLCLWCSITEKDKEVAASSNVLRAFSEAGILESYVRGFNEIGKKP